MDNDVDKFIIIVYGIVKYFGGFTMSNFNEEMVREFG